jgi:hypothetical protein
VEKGFAAYGATHAIMRWSGETFESEWFNSPGVGVCYAVVAKSSFGVLLCRKRLYKAQWVHQSRYD